MTKPQPFRTNKLNDNCFFWVSEICKVDTNLGPQNIGNMVLTLTLLCTLVSHVF